MSPQGLLSQREVLCLCCLHVSGMDRKVRVIEAPTGHQKSPAILLSLVTVLVWGAKSPSLSPEMKEFSLPKQSSLGGRT